VPVFLSITSHLVASIKNGLWVQTCFKNCVLSRLNCCVSYGLPRAIQTLFRHYFMKHVVGTSYEPCVMLVEDSVVSPGTSDKGHKGEEGVRSTVGSP
jgi:hypothetical protein